MKAAKLAELNLLKLQHLLLTPVAVAEHHCSELYMLGLLYAPSWYVGLLVYPQHLLYFDESPELKLGYVQ